MDEDRQAQSEAARLLCGHNRGTLLADGAPVDIRFVSDRRDGSLAARVPSRFLEADEHTLCLPDDSFDTQLRALIRPVGEPSGVSCDRLLAYHPSHRTGVPARFVVEFVKLASGGVVDGEDVMNPSPLAACEPRLCTMLNAEPDGVRRIARRLAGVRIETPLVVGVDPGGFDVRAAHGVVRVELPAPCPDEQTATQVLDALLRECADG